MSRVATLSLGARRTIILIAVAALLASFATVTTSAVRPERAFALASCNATYNPPTADRIQINFTNLSIAADGSGIYFNPTTGKFYTVASGPADANLAPTAIEFVVTSGEFSGSDIWCVLVDQEPIGDKKGNDLDTTTGVFFGQTALAGFPIGSEVCVTAMISAASGSGAPKNRACFNVGRHTATTTPTNPPTTPPTTPPTAPPTAPPSPDASVAGVTSRPAATTPPTDALGQAGSSAPTFGLVLLILAAIAGTLGLLTPATKRIRR